MNMNIVSSTKTQPTHAAFKFFSVRMVSTVCLLILLRALSVTARADTIVSSLGNTPVDAINFGNGSWAASAFQTDGQSWNLSSVTVLLGEGGIGSSTADLRLYSDVAGMPGVSLVDLGPRTFSGGGQPSPMTFTLGTSFTLAPSTTYWVAVGNPSLTQGLNVGILSSNVPPAFNFSGVPGATMTYAVTSSTGAGVIPPTTWATPGPDVALLFQVDGSPVSVPEPGQIAFIGLGAICFFLRRQPCRNR